MQKQQIVHSYVRNKKKETEAPKPKPSAAVPVTMLVTTVAASALVYPGIILTLVLAVTTGYAATKIMRREHEAVIETSEEVTEAPKKRRKKKPKFVISLSI